MVGILFKPQLLIILEVTGRGHIGLQWFFIPFVMRKEEMREGVLQKIQNCIVSNDEQFELRQHVFSYFFKLWLVMQVREIKTCRFSLQLAFFLTYIYDFVQSVQCILIIRSNLTDVIVPARSILMLILLPGSIVVFRHVVSNHA